MSLPGFAYFPISDVCCVIDCNNAAGVKEAKARLQEWGHFSALEALLDALRVHIETAHAAAA